MSEEVEAVIQSPILDHRSPSPLLGYSHRHSHRNPASPQTSQLPTHFAGSSRIASIEIEECLGSNTMTISSNEKDAWLPITESRNGNTYYSAFHTLNSGIGFQALMLPVAFTLLGWTWGIILLSVVFGWQFYTIWLLIQLHESEPGGTRYSRYLHLSIAAFGTKLGKLLALFPIVYLSSASCSMILITAGETMSNFMEPLTITECYLLFIFVAIILGQLPNMNSRAWISFIGAVAAVSCCTMLWVISVTKSRPENVSYNPVKSVSDISSLFKRAIALGLIALSFRGHNLILEIQATMPTSEKCPSCVPMWRGVKWAYLVIAFCLYPLCIGGYWAYGDKIPNPGGMMNALYTFHKHDTSKIEGKSASILLVIHCLCSFQIVSMPALDNMEFVYVNNKNIACSRGIRSWIRVFFGCCVFFIAVAIPFIKGLTGVLGGIALPVTFSYPCFMWIAIKKPERCRAMWWINLVLGSLGIVLSVGVFAGGIYSLVDPGIDIHLFKP